MKGARRRRVQSPAPVDDDEAFARFCPLAALSSAADVSRPDPAEARNVERRQAPEVEIPATPLPPDDTPA